VSLIKSIIFIVFTVIVVSCKKDPELITIKLDSTYFTTPFELIIPDLFSAKSTTEPANNPMTEEGVLLGRMLFYDPILSGDSSISCSSCHKQENGFTDDIQFSKGITGEFGDRNSMHIVNALWSEPFFWDGRAISLEEQALEPLANPLEMNLKWEDAMLRLNRHTEYPDLFYKAFGSDYIDSIQVAKAISQFERTLVSASSKWDEFRRSEVNPFLFFTPLEFVGYTVFFTETGDCFHCHGQRELLTDNLFHNNGMEENIVDIGLEIFTSNPNDKGKFKTPSLRNIEYTAPFMHDGRFQTLEDVIDHYSHGVVYSETVDPLMKKVNQGGLLLSQEEKNGLLAFLKTFSDTSFIQNSKFSSPF
jgi:cytochrome c peroxidase